MKDTELPTARGSGETILSTEEMGSQVAKRAADNSQSSLAYHAV